MRLLVIILLLLPSLAFAQLGSGGIAQPEGSTLGTLANGLPLGNNTASPIVQLNGMPGGARGVTWQAAGIERWHLQTNGSDDLSLYAYAPQNGAYGGNPLLFQYSNQTIHMNWPLTVTSYTTPADSASAGPVFSTHNTGTNGGIGSLTEYFSSADAPNFDVASQIIAAFDPTAWRSCTTIVGSTCAGPGNLAQFVVALSPNDTAHLWGTNVAEWNIVNRGLDMGWRRDRSLQQTTGGLLLVPETNISNDPNGGEGKNAGFAFSVSRSANANSTGDSAKFYNGYLCEPNSIVGSGQAVTSNGGTAEGYCLYATGDITGATMKLPYAPIGLDGAWLHGITTTKATFSDNLALHLSGSQSLGFDSGTSAATISGSGSGANEGLVLTPAGLGLVQIAGSAQIGAATATSAVVNFNAAATAARNISFQTAGVTHWQLGLSPNPESGSNVGADIGFYRYADDGSFLGAAMTIARASGLVTLGSGESVTGGIATDTLTMSGLTKLAAYPTSALPPCNTTNRDAVAVVTDATSPAYRGSIIGGGTVRTLAYCDGSTWTTH